MDFGNIRLLLGCSVLFTVVILQILVLQYKLIEFSNKALRMASSMMTSLETFESIDFKYDSDYKEILFNQSQNTNGKDKQLPDALIIGLILFNQYIIHLGVRKGGTRALLDALSLHPNIKIARKEIHFFDDESNYNQGLEWYRQQMPYSTINDVTIEKTPSYFINLEASKRIHQFNPEIKLILIVRDPVIRTIKFNKIYKPIRNSLYSEHMKHWLQRFPLKQILILDGDKFIRNPLSQLKLVEKFLGLESKIELDQLVFNRKKGFYCFRRRGKSTAKCLGETKGRKQVFISKKTKAMLRDNFNLFNQQFFFQINRNFPFW